MRRLLHKCYAAILLVAGFGIATSCAAAPLDPDKFTACTDGSLTDLRNAIEAHNENTWKLNRKFKDIWYPQGRAPDEVRKAVRLEHVYEFLAALRPRRAAVLFHAAAVDRLCTWLLRADRAPVSNVLVVKSGVADLVQPKSWHLLGVRGAKKLRTATPVDVAGGSESLATQQEWDKVLERVSQVLLPDPIAKVLCTEKIDTLIVVPISVRKLDPVTDVEESSGTSADTTGSLRRLRPESRVALSVSVVPFSALRVGNAFLVERMSVVIAPGFFAFARDPLPVRSKFSQPIVIGDPRHSRFQSLDGARREAIDVANLLATEALIGERATKAGLESFLQKNADTVEFIHLATHGVADSDNPVDESYLVFSDGQWNARAISGLRKSVRALEGGRSVERDLPLLEHHPLVVMSACQTALGKDFPAGTIGLARAWHWAGAANVVMSLWSVDDMVTRELMARFIGKVTDGLPTDKALQAAMLAIREHHPSPAHWASFSVYGAPERSH